MSLLDKIKNNSTIKLTSVLEDSFLFKEKVLTNTGIPALNIAFSGDINGGFGSGLTLFAGPSRHFKTLFTLICAKAYMDEHPDAILLFYDNEFGTPVSYFHSLGIDTGRIIHTPISNIEELKFDLMQQINKIERGEKVFIAVDSIGNLASKKEVDDALDGKSVADMTRAKQLKSLFRMVTPELTTKNLPMICVNHVYQETGLFAKTVVSGGTGPMYSSDNIFIIGRRQEKEGTEVMGYSFVINVEKSRHSKEKTKIPIVVKHTGGINRYSGLMDIALEGGFTAKPKNGWYCKVNQETGELEDKNWRLKDTDTKEFWQDILESEKFKQYIKDNFQPGHGELLESDETDANDE